MKRLNSIDEEGEWRQPPPPTDPSSSASAIASSQRHRPILSPNSSSSLASSSVPALPSHSSSQSFLNHLNKMISNGSGEDAKLSSQILDCLVDEALLKSKSPSSHWKEKFLNIDWSNIENQRHEPFLSLSLVLAESLDFLLTENDSRILLQTYSLKKSQQKRFHWKKFLFDFFTKLAAKEIEQDQQSQDQSDRGGSGNGGEGTSRGHGQGYQLWQHVHEKINIIRAMTAFKASGAEKARHRALLLLLNAIGKLQCSRFGPRGEMNFAASINRSDFRK
jgi:hypothetical protein